MSTAFLKYSIRVTINLVTSSRPFLDIKIPEGCCQLVGIFRLEVGFQMKLFSRFRQGIKLKFAMTMSIDI